MSHESASPSPGTPGEGWGGGLLLHFWQTSPHPRPPPEYREREESGSPTEKVCFAKGTRRPYILTSHDSAAPYRQSLRPPADRRPAAPPPPRPGRAGARPGGAAGGGGGGGENPCGRGAARGRSAGGAVATVRRPQLLGVAAPGFPGRDGRRRRSRAGGADVGPAPLDRAGPRVPDALSSEGAAAPAPAGRRAGAAVHAARLGRPLFSRRQGVLPVDAGHAGSAGAGGGRGADRRLLAAEQVRPERPGPGRVPRAGADRRLPRRRRGRHRRHGVRDEDHSGRR